MGWLRSNRGPSELWWQSGWWQARERPWPSRLRPRSPTQWGFAYVDTAVGARNSDVNHQAGSWPAPFKVHVKPGGVGQVAVTFPQIGGPGGVVSSPRRHRPRGVVPAQAGGRQVRTRRPLIRCYQAGGSPVFLPSRPRLREHPETASIPPGPARTAMSASHPAPGSSQLLNSSAGTNTVIPAAVGVWVYPPWPRLIDPGRDVQLTAVHSGQSRPVRGQSGGRRPQQPNLQVRC